MPAIQPARLRQQAAAIAEHFDQPAAFVRSLHHLFDFYADRTHRPGRKGFPPPLIPAYNVRPPVLRALVHALIPYVEEDGSAALALCDALWRENYLEFSLLAAALLGQIPPDPVPPVVERLHAWLTPRLDHHLVVALLDDGLARLRTEHPQAVLDLIQVWLESEAPQTQVLGLQALNRMASATNTAQLPVLFRLLEPFFHEPISISIRPVLVDVLSSLARRSPQEVAFFLLKSLSNQEHQDAPRLTRQVLPAFPAQQQETLRQALRSARN